MKFEARIMELQEDEFSTVGGSPIDHEDAAEAYAEEVDPDTEYAIMKAGEMVVEVREVGTSDVKTFKVIGESRPSYSAREIKEPARKYFTVEYKIGHKIDDSKIKEVILAKNQWDAARIIRIKNNRAWCVRITESVEVVYE